MSSSDSFFLISFTLSGIPSSNNGCGFGSKFLESSNNFASNFLKKISSFTNALMISVLLSYSFNAFLKTPFLYFKNFLSLCFFLSLRYNTWQFFYTFLILFRLIKWNFLNSLFCLLSHFVFLLSQGYLLFHLINQLINHSMYQIFFKKTKIFGTKIIYFQKQIIVVDHQFFIINEYFKDIFLFISKVFIVF